MKKYEEKFWEILSNLFVGAETQGESGVANLMKAKFTYFEKVKTELLTQINQTCKNNNDFKEELYNKLYSFFYRYFNESGSIYYNYTPLFYNIYTQAYQSDTPFTNYEQIFSDKQDTYLFYKTKMLYYIKSVKVFKDLEIDYKKPNQEIKIKFDTSGLDDKEKEKTQLIYELLSIDDLKPIFKVSYSSRGRKTKVSEICKKLQKAHICINEEDIQTWFRIFEKQSNIDYFINKNAKKFLSEQLNLWVYQYMFSQEVEFGATRIQEIQDFKNIANQIIHFISQFEDELAKIWNKPRFALNSNLVVTLDKLQEKGFDISKLISHPNYPLQQQEWEELEIPQENNLIENPYLPIDTKYFLDLKEEIEDLFGENEFDGLLIKSENYQALNTLLPRFKGKIDLIYIDPPFNTGGDFAYIDRFKESTWLSLMENRLELAHPLLSRQGSLLLHLDHNASHRGKELMDKIFGKENFRNEIIWAYRSGGASKSGRLPRKHDNIWFYSKSQDFQISPIYERQYYDVNFMNSCRQDNQGRWYTDTLLRDILEDTLQIVENDQPMEYSVKPVLNVSAEHISFDTQKPEGLLSLLFKISNLSNNSVILDYHLGSGTTIAAAQKLGRKWIGIEMGEHFYDIIIPRMKKVLGGFECGISGDTQYRGGGIFKYYELEQYEQILKKIKYNPTPQTFLNHTKSNEIKDCFLFDKKLSDAIIEEAQGFKVDVSKLYENIDLKESIRNITGKEPLEITDTKVRFQDYETNLLEVLKPLLVW